MEKKIVTAPANMFSSRMEKFNIKEFIQMAAFSIRYRGKSTTFLNISRNIPVEKREEFKTRAVELYKYFSKHKWNAENICYVSPNRPIKLNDRVCFQVQKYNSNKREVQCLGTVVGLKNSKENDYYISVRWDLDVGTTLYARPGLYVLKPTPDDAIH